MVEKRLGKFAAIARDAVPPDLYGPPNARHLLVCWGSTLEAVRGAVSLLLLKTPGVAILHFTHTDSDKV